MSEDKTFVLFSKEELDMMLDILAQELHDAYQQPEGYQQRLQSLYDRILAEREYHYETSGQ